MKVIPREVKRRKPITWSREIRELQERLKLNSFQKKVLIGTLLGDGCLTPNVYGTNYRLQIAHGDDQKEYLWWKYEIFKEWILSEPKFAVKTNSWRFRTISHPEFTVWQRKFYRRKQKILPKEIDLIFKDPLTLAIWFMDDGGKMIDRTREYGYLLNVQQFSLGEVRCIQEVLLKNFSLSSTRQWNNTGYRLYFGKKSRKGLDKTIRDFIHPCLKYKLLLTP